MSVTLVHSQGINAAVEGDDSKAAEIFTRDIYPPAEPTGLQAVFSSVGQKPFVDLTWAPNMESDLAGYNVFRRVAGGEPVKLNQQLVPVPSFRDDKVAPGKTYLYYGFGGRCARKRKPSLHRDDGSRTRQAITEVLCDSAALSLTMSRAMASSKTSADQRRGPSDS